MKSNQFFENFTVKKSAWASLPILALIIAGSVLFPSTRVNSQTVQAAPPCTLATLNGSYTTTRSGFVTPNVFSPFAQIGQVTFDGAGNFEGFFFAKSPLGPTKGTLKGTYKVKPNCSGSLTGEAHGKTFSSLVIAHSGEKYYAIPTGKGPLGPEVVSIGTGKRQ